MTAPTKDHRDVNVMLLSGQITSDLEIRHGRGDLLIVHFEVETYEQVGKTIHATPWRGTCFGEAAEFARKNLRRGLRVFIEGSLSGHRDRRRRQQPRTRLPEVLIRKFWADLPMEISTESTFGETTPEERRRMLEEDLNS